MYHILLDCLLINSIGTHYVLFHSIQHSTATHRDMGNKLFLRTIPTFATLTAAKDSAFVNSALALRDYWKSLNLKLSVWCPLSLSRTHTFIRTVLYIRVHTRTYKHMNTEYIQYSTYDNIRI